jgi:hypothetical protein
MQPYPKSSVARSQLSYLDHGFHTHPRFSGNGDAQRILYAAARERPYSIPRDRYERLDLIDYDHWAEIRAKLRSQGARVKKTWRDLQH